MINVLQDHLVKSILARSSNAFNFKKRKRIVENIIIILVYTNSSIQSTRSEIKNDYDK